MSTLRAVPAQPARLSDRVAAEVRGQLARQQITQQELAAAVGLSQASISERLRGKTPFTTDDLERIADALGVHPATLLGGYTASPPPPPTSGLINSTFTRRNHLGSANAMRTAVPHTGSGWAPATPVAA